MMSIMSGFSFTPIIYQVGYLQRLYRDARSTEHSIHSPSWLHACCNQYNDLHVPTSKWLRSFKFTIPAAFNAKWTTHGHFTQVPRTIYYPAWRRKCTTFIQIMPFKLKLNSIHLLGESHKTQQFYHTQSLHQPGHPTTTAVLIIVIKETPRMLVTP
jgi:hypothetical protein